MNMRTWAVVALCLGSVSVLSWRYATVTPAPPAYSHARTGLLAVGQAGTDRNKLAAAVADLHEALRLDAEDPVAHFGMGWALQLSGDGEQAKVHYHQAMAQMDPLGCYARYNLALLHEEDGDLAGALRLVDEVLRVNADFPSAHRKAASLQLKAGNRLAAQQHLAASAKVSPDDAAALALLAANCRRSGDKECLDILGQRP